MDRVNVYRAAGGKVHPLQHLVEVLAPQQESPPVTAAHPLRNARRGAGNVHVSQSLREGAAVQFAPDLRRLTLGRTAIRIVKYQVDHPVERRIAHLAAKLHFLAV